MYYRGTPEDLQRYCRGNAKRYCGGITEELLRYCSGTTEVLQGYY